MTTWALTGFFAAMAVYAEFLSRSNIPQLWRVGLVLLAAALLMRFFAHSCIAYGYARKWEYIRNMIEDFWIGKKGLTLDDLVKEIEGLDHTTKITKKKRRLATTQMKAGFLPIIVVTCIILAYELFGLSGYRDFNIQLMIEGFAVYALYELILFKSYKRIQRPTTWKDAELK